MSERYLLMDNTAPTRDSLGPSCRSNDKFLLVLFISGREEILANIHMVWGLKKKRREVLKII